MNPMKKFAALLLMIVLVLLAQGAVACYAANQSQDKEVYVSTVTWYDGTPEEGMRLSALQTGQHYDLITAVAEVEWNVPVPTLESLTVIGGVYRNDELLDSNQIQQSLEPVTRIEMTFADILPESEQFRLGLFVWASFESMRPVANGQFLYSSAEPVSQTDLDMQIVRERIANDNNLYSTTANPQSLLDQLGSDGRFRNIDYSSTAQTTWPVSAALANAATMLKAYYTEGNSWYSNQSLKEAIDAVLGDWAAHGYKSTNWWYQEIDVPNKLSQILLYPLEGESYLPDLRQLALLGMPKTNDALPHLSSDTGANLTDKLLTAAKIAAATNDAASMRTVVTRLLDNELSVFDFANGGEGIMIDGSMHQHGALFYSGSYGSVYCTDVNKLLGYLEDTEFMVSSRALNTYADFILDGQSLLFKNGMSDFACFGRAVSRRGGVGGSVKNNCLGAANILLEQPRVERRTELLALKQERLGSIDQGTDLAKHFWTSDFTVLHRKGFYVSVRNSSSRNKNTEYMNSENSKAYYIADGTTVIMRTGQEYRDIFPVWDWSHIPGTTTNYLAFDAIPSPAAEYGTNVFVGGVDNGRYAVTAMDYSHPDTDKQKTVTAKKANFLFDQGFLALGAGITGATAGKEVHTTLNQCILNGRVSYSAAGRTESIPLGESRNLTDTKWILQDSVGYYFPKPAAVTAAAQTKSGSWHAINTSQSNANVSNNIFSLYLNHGVQPQEQSYSYSVLPNVTAEQLNSYAQSPDMIEIVNTQMCQAVWSMSAQSAGIVFWNQGVSNYRESVTIPADRTGLDQDLVVTAAKDPCLVLLTRTETGWELCVSNPKNNELAQTTIELNRKLSGENAAVDGDTTTVTVSLPQGQERGKSVVIPLTEVV